MLYLNQFKLKGQLFLILEFTFVAQAIYCILFEIVFLHNFFVTVIECAFVTTFTILYLTFCLKDIDMTSIYYVFLLLLIYIGFPELCMAKANVIPCYVFSVIVYLLVLYEL